MKKALKTIYLFATILSSFLFAGFVFAQNCPLQTTVSGTSVTFVGELTDMGGDSVVYAWFEYGKSQSLENKTSEISLTRTGLYCLTISGLSPCTTYYYRAVARNSAGTSFGEIKSFTTTCQSGSFEIEKKMRNLSDGGSFEKEILADPGEMIEVQIKIKAKEALNQVRVKDEIPEKTKIIEGSLKVDGQSKEGNIVSGIDLGNLVAGQEKIITFKLTLFGSDQFAFGETKLVNKATVTSENKVVSDTATILVKKTGVLGASTGFEIKNSFLLPIILALLCTIFSHPLLKEFAQILERK